MKTRLARHRLPTRFAVVALTLAVVAGIILTTASHLGVGHQHLNLPALGLVLGGTLLASCISHSAREVRRLLQRLWAKGSDDNAAHVLDDLTTMARLWARADVRGMESALPALAHPLLRTGVQLLINQTPVHQAIDLLHARIARMDARAQAQAQMLRAMAGFASAFGVLGSVIGLVGMAAQLTDNTTTTVGPQLAVALMSTCYGLACATLIFRPLALRLERQNDAQLATMQLIVQGIAMMADKRGASALRESLQTVLDAEADVTPPVASTAAATSASAPTPRRNRAGQRATQATQSALNTRPARLLHGCYATPF